MSAFLTALDAETQVTQNNVFSSPAVPHVGEPLFAYMIKREIIRRRKEAGEPWPWTDDPILRDYSFTNVRRSDDRTTRELIAKFYAPNVASAAPGDVLFNCSLARFINRADSVMKIGWQSEWDARAVAASITSMRAALPNGETFFTSAYKIPVVRKDCKVKEDDVCHNLLTLLWRKRREIAAEAMKPKCGWERLCSLLREFKGVGPLMAKEIAQDFILVTGWQPRDLNTFTPIGPGARQGLNRLYGRDVEYRKSATGFRIEYQFLCEVRELYAVRHQFLPPDFVELQLHDIQFNLCELDKYLRTLRGEGKPKRRYVA